MVEFVYGDCLFFIVCSLRKLGHRGRQASVFWMLEKLNANVFN